MSLDNNPKNQHGKQLIKTFNIYLTASSLQMLIRNGLLSIDENKDIRINVEIATRLNINYPICAYIMRTYTNDASSNKLIYITQHGISSHYSTKTTPPIYNDYIEHITAKYNTALQNYLTDLTCSTCEIFEPISAGEFGKAELKIIFDYVIDIVLALKILCKCVNTEKFTRESKIYAAKNSQFKGYVLQSGGISKSIELNPDNIDKIVWKRLTHAGRQYIFVGYPNTHSMANTDEYYNHELHQQELERQRNNYMTNFIALHNELCKLFNKPTNMVDSDMEYYKLIDYDNNIKKYYFEVIVPNYFNFNAEAIAAFRAQFTTMAAGILGHEIAHQIAQINTVIRYQYYIFNGENGEDIDFCPAFYSIRQFNELHHSLLIEFELYIKQSLSAKFQLGADSVAISDNFLMAVNISSIFSVHVDYVHPLANINMMGFQAQKKLLLSQIIELCRVKCEAPIKQYQRCVGIPILAVLDFEYDIEAFKIYNSRHKTELRKRSHILRAEIPYELGIGTVSEDLYGVLSNSSAEIIYFISSTLPNKYGILRHMAIIKISGLQKYDEFVYLELEGYQFKIDDFAKPIRRGKYYSATRWRHNIYQSQTRKPYYKIMRLHRLGANLEIAAGYLYGAVFTYKIQISPHKLKSLQMEYMGQKLNIPHNNSYVNMIVKNFALALQKQSHDKSHRLPICTLLKKSKCNRELRLCEDDIVDNDMCYYEDDLFYYRLLDSSKYNFLKSTKNRKFSAYSIVIYPIPKKVISELIDNYAELYRSNPLKLPIISDDLYMCDITGLKYHIQYEKINAVIAQIYADLNISMDDYDLYIHNSGDTQFQALHLHIRPRAQYMIYEYTNNSLNSQQTFLRFSAWKPLYNYRMANPNIAYYMHNNKCNIFYLFYIILFASSPQYTHFSITAATLPQNRNNIFYTAGKAIPNIVNNTLPQRAHATATRNKLKVLNRMHRAVNSANLKYNITRKNNKFNRLIAV